jgi:uncharacterized membrane protein
MPGAMRERQAFMPKPEKKKTFQKIFISGILILIPIMVTLFILGFMFNLLDSWLSPYGAQILRTLGVDLPHDWKQIPGFGILATFILICLTGLFASNYLGRRMLAVIDQFMASLPLINHVYGGMRQLVDAFSQRQGTAFKTVVMLEFPSPGIWTLGFLTTPSSTWAKRHVSGDLMNVFVPAAPIPSAGILVMVPRRKLKVLPLSVEEAFKIVATLGIVAGKEKVPALPEPVAARLIRKIPRRKKA